MSHRSQATKVEYADKHESNITSKMANIWERKIGSEKEHKPSPTSVTRPSTEKIDPINRLPRAGSKKASSQLRRKNTKEMVQTFERMSSNKSTANIGLAESNTGERRASKHSSALEKDRKTATYGNEKKVNSEVMGDINKLIEHLSRQLSEMNNDLSLLKSKVNSL